MDEEKPFPIELIVILIIIALANDIAEIFFDILDLTGVGLAGEAIMEPADLVLDAFFTGFFWWKVGVGGTPTIIQYVDDLLEVLFIPGRTLSVAAGIWVANHPDSALSKIATEVSSVEAGNIGGVAGEAENTAEALAKETESVAQSGQKTLQGESAPAGAGDNRGNESPASAQRGGSSTPEPGTPERGDFDENIPQGDIFKNPLDAPVATAGENIFNPTEDAIQERKISGPAGDSQNDPPRPDRTYNTKRGVADVRPPEDLKKVA